MIRFALTILLLATALVYAPVLGHDFVHYDDPGYVFENEMVRPGISAEGLRWALTSGHQGNWHPVTWYSHMLDAQLYGPDRAGLHHLSNLLLHLLNIILVYLVFAGYFGHRGRALWIAAVFALHPLHVESVAWIAERKDLLSATFWFASMLAYLRYTKGSGYRAYLLCLLLLMLGLATKPMLVTVPFLLLLLDAWPLRRFTRFAILEKLPMIALVLATSLVTYRVQDAWGSVWNPPWSNRIANALTAYPRYCAKFLWPSDLAVIYPNHVGMWSSLQVMAAVSFLLLISLLLVWQRKRPALLVGWLWFLGTLVPVIGIVTVGRQSIADRYTYVPILGLALTCAWLFEWVRRGRGGSLLAWCIGVLAVGAMATRTAQHLPVWKDSPTLFEHALAVTTDNETMHNNMGTWLFRNGRHTESIPHYEAALSISDGYTQARDNLILAFEATGRFEEAAAQAEFQLKASPDDVDYLLLAARNLRRCGKPEAALRYYAHILRLAPDSPIVWNNRGGVLLDLLRFDEAIASFERAIQLDAGYTLAHQNLAITLLRAGRRGEALDHLRSVLRYDPGNSALRSFAEQLGREPH